MSSTSGISQSGLQVASQRLAVSANNVANVNTPGFVPSRVAVEEREGGGVSGQVVRGNDPQFEARLDRTLAGLSGTDLAQETVEQMAASAAFRANVATLRTADEALEALLRVGE
jgi:flagellar basal-body rod protein FlgC